MPTYAQLESESWWRNEAVPPNLATLGRRVREALGLNPEQIGTRGDNTHMNGYHRSRAWIQNSRYCTSRTYSVSRTPGDRVGGDPNWVCALDVAAPNSILMPMCQRLDAIVRAGRMEKVTEWFGNRDGDSRVDGYDNIANRVASSDSSHLWHLHISFDRARANEDHADLLAVLIGDDMFELPDRNVDWATTNRANALLSNLDSAEYQLHGEPSRRREPNKLKEQLNRIETAANKPVPVALTPEDRARIVTELAALVPTADQIAELVAAKLAARLAQ
jgi:hypothetical protein